MNHILQQDMYCSSTYTSLINFISEFSSVSSPADGRTLLHAAVDGSFAETARESFTTWRSRSRIACYCLPETHVKINAPQVRSNNNDEMNIYLQPCINTVNLLLDGGSDVDAVDSEGNTALHYCAHHLTETSLDLMVLLVHRGAHIDVRNKQGLTAWDILLSSINVKNFCPSLEKLAQALAVPENTRILIQTQNENFKIIVKNAIFSHVSLQCLSARAVRSNNISFSDYVPRRLVNIILLH